MNWWIKIVAIPQAWSLMLMSWFWEFPCDITNRCELSNDFEKIYFSHKPIYKSSWIECYIIRSVYCLLQFTKDFGPHFLGRFGRKWLKVDNFTNYINLGTPMNYLSH